MSRLVERTLDDFIHALSAPTPTPGGGSAAAAAGAMGAALLGMVAALPKTRTGHTAEREALDGAVRELAACRTQLAALIDEDSASFEAVTAAYRLPRSAEDEKAARGEAIQRALRGATEVPLAVMRACRTAAVHGLTVARFGTPSAASDTAVGFELAGAGLRGAALNARINMDSLKDAEFVRVAEAEVRGLEAALEEAAAEARRLLA